MLFGKKKSTPAFSPNTPVERVTTVLGPGINWKGDLRGKGGVRIEGTLEGEIAVKGMVIVGETGRVTCDIFKADTIIVAGAVKGQIVANKLEIRSTGRIYGDVNTVSFATEEGAFLRGKVTMEDEVDLSDLSSPEETTGSDDAADEQTKGQSEV